MAPVASAPLEPLDKDEDVMLTFCLQKFDALTSIIASLDTEAVNWRPDHPGANSLAAVLAHC